MTRSSANQLKELLYRKFRTEFTVPVNILIRKVHGSEVYGVTVGAAYGISCEHVLWEKSVGRAKAMIQKWIIGMNLRIPGRAIYKLRIDWREAA